MSKVKSARPAIVIPSSKPRNPLVLPSLFRKAGAHSSIKRGDAVHRRQLRSELVDMWR